MNIRDVAISGAKKICGSGQCICGFDCGHSNKAPAALPKVGTETVCPLARYEVEPQPVSDPFGPPVTQDEIYALCRMCPHAKVESEEDGPERLTRVDFYEACLDCPVKACEDAMQEAEAEGGSDNAVHWKHSKAEWDARHLRCDWRPAPSVV